MIELTELAVDLWIYGLPIVIAVWAVLRLSGRISARARYVVAATGLVAAIVVPLLLSFAEDVAPLPIGVAALAEPPAALPSRVTWAWVIGAALLVVQNLVAHGLLALRRRDYSPADAGLRDALQWPDGVPLLVGSVAPMTAGLFRPYVVVPEGLLDEVDRDVARSIARHELAHVAWRDPLVYATARAISALFWIAPAWLLLTAIRREREFAADEAAVHDARGADGYVSALLETCRRSIRERRLAASITGGDLHARIRKLLGLQQTRFSWAGVGALTIASWLLISAGPARFAIERVSPAIVPSQPVKSETSRESIDVQTPAPARRIPRNAIVKPLVDEPLRWRDVTAVNLTPGIAPPESPPPDPAPRDHVDVHVEGDTHVDVHIDDEPDRKVIRIRNVIRR